MKRGKAELFRERQWPEKGRKRDKQLKKKGSVDRERIRGHRDEL